MSKKNEALLSPGLSLIRPDLEGYDEIYVITPMDLYPSTNDAKTAGLGIDVLDRGQMAQKLADKHPEHYGALLQTLLELRENAVSSDNNRSFGESTLSMGIGKGDKQFKVGIIFLPATATDWKTLGPSGILEETRNNLETDFIKQRKQIANFITLPHEAGHLVEHLRNNKLVLDTNISIEETLERHKKEGLITALNDEIAGDKYMSGVFEKAKNLNLVSHPEILERFLNFRTIKAIDTAMETGAFEEHATTLFNEGSIFQTSPVQHKEEYSTFTAQRLKSGVDKAISDAFSNAVGKENIPPSLQWVKEAEDCLRRSTVGWRDTHLTSERLKAEFTSCTTMNFETRYGVIQQVTQAAPIGTGLNEIGNAYDGATSKEFPAEKKIVTPTQVKTAPAP